MKLINSIIPTLILFALNIANGFAQEISPLAANKTSTIMHGRVAQEATAAFMPDVSIACIYQNTTTLTDTHGNFSILLQNDTATIRISYVGFEPIDTFIRTDNAASYVFNLKPNTAQHLNEITITDNHQIQKSSQMGMISLPMAQIQSMPKFFGEADVMKTLQTLPGVQQGSEGSSALLVRGGSPDQNLILIDGTPIYNPSHLIGIFSAINTNAIQSVDLYKGAFPARFGGRLSSVIDLQTKNGDMNKIHGNVSVGLIMSQLTLEGPIQKGKTSFILSGRRTYHDLYAGPVIRSIESDIKKLAFYFYDFNGKIHHRFSDKNYLDLSFTSGADNLKLKTESKSDFENHTSSLNSAISWNNIVSNLKFHHHFSSKLSAEASASLSRYRFSTNLNSSEMDNNVQTYSYSLGLKSGILDYIGRTDFLYRPNDRHSIRFGAMGTYHTYDPSTHFEKQTVDSGTLTNDVVNSKINATELDIYAEDDWEITSKLKANIGVHANAFMVQGKNYFSLQPRISARYLLPNDMAIKASFVQMSQNIHLLSSNSLSLPTDLWIPATKNILPEKANQFSIGIAKNILQNKVEFSLEGYYKQMENVVEYKEGASYLNAITENTWEDKITTGKGTSYGAELLLQKKVGRLTGSFSYTLAWSNRQFAEINHGRTFPYKYDRRHTLNVVAIYKLKKNIELSGAFTFQSASPYTLPSTEYDGVFQPGVNYNVPIEYYPERNNIRIQANHRLDLGISFIKEKKNGNVRTWNISLYNAYNRRNLFYYDVGKYSSNSVTINGYSILPILPSVSYNIKF